MERADETGGAGSLFAGGGWLLAAVLVAAAASMAHTARGRRERSTS